jgi:DNA replication protein DnaC
LNKGLYLYGVYGVGKTMFFRIFRAYLNAIGRSYTSVTSDELSSKFAQNGFESIEDYCKIRANMNGGESPVNLFIDDVGQGSNSVKYFGSATNIVVEVLQRRYRCLTEAGLFTHISTNIEPKEIKELYGEYINSRMKEMFNPILFYGKDKRK